MSLNSFKTGVAQNSRLKCKAPHCMEPRHILSRYCSTHKNIDQYWGDPEAVKINKKEIAPYLDEVDPIVNQNLSHEGISFGIKFFDLWMKNAAAGAKLPGGVFFNRLFNLGVSPVDLLKIAAACFLLALRTPTRVKTVRQRNYYLANRLFQANPTAGRGKAGNGFHHQASGKDRREVGEYVQKNLSALLLNICNACDRKEEEEQKRLRSFYAPLEI